jgi:hypothetical protein
MRQQRRYGSMNAAIELPREKRVDERVANSRKLISGRPSKSFSQLPYENSRRSLRKKEEHHLLEGATMSRRRQYRRMNR